VSVSEALPDYHVRERHSVQVAASPEQALAAARAVTLDDVPLVRALFRLRGLSAPTC
jgi:DNA-binding response OmpR family regulator